MINRQSFSLFPVIVGLIALATSGQAAINVPTVLVGDPGNQDRVNFGAVSYEYEIGTYEVTNSEYAAFLNSVASTDTHDLYNTDMDGATDAVSGLQIGGIGRTGSSGSYSYNVLSGFGDRPVNFVSFWDAARFANWLTNGQPTGAQNSSSTESGMYALGGVTKPTGPITRQVDFSAMNESGFAVSSRDEWVKAAGYSGSPTGAPGGRDGYWDYPTQSNTVPSISEGNFDDSSPSVVGTTTVVGSYAFPSHYGTYDQLGNVHELTDDVNDFNGTTSEMNTSYTSSASIADVGYWLTTSLDGERGDTGFRITKAVPEPSAYGLLVGLLALGLVGAGRRCG